MKKIILIATILCLSSCSFFNQKSNEELQFYSFNEANKPIVKKSDIYLTKVTRFDTFSKATAKVVTDYNNKVDIAGSWDFSQKPSKKLKDEIFDQSIKLGTNYIIMFEKTNCVTLDVERSRFEASDKSNCYKIYYYHLPTNPPVVKNDEPEVKSTKTADKISEESGFEQKELKLEREPSAVNQ